MTERVASSIRIRRADKNDLDTVVEFNAAMAHETEGKTLDLERLRNGVAAALTDSARGFYLMAEADQQVVGQLLITTEWSDWRNGYFWWIQSVYVRATHRRRGVYRALESHVRQEAHRRGDVCGLRLYVDQENRAAQKVYESLDMKQSRYYMYEIDFDA